MVFHLTHTLLILLGWFPFLFYSATWVGETYFRFDATGQEHVEKDMVSEIGRIGSTTLIVFSCITLTTSVTSPWLIRTPDEDTNSMMPRTPSGIGGSGDVLPRTRRKPALITVWLYSHFIFVCAMALAPFVTSLRMASTLVAMCGL